MGPHSGENELKAYTTITKPQTYTAFLSIAHHIDIGEDFHASVYWTSPSDLVRDIRVITSMNEGQNYRHGVLLTFLLVST